MFCCKKFQMKNFLSLLDNNEVYPERNKLDFSAWVYLDLEYIQNRCFIIRTVLLYVLGVEYLGLNNLFTSLLSFLSLAELGVGSALVYAMYKPIADGDDNAVCALLKLYKRLYRIIGLSTIVSLIISVPWSTYVMYSNLFKESLKQYYISFFKYALITVVACVITFLTVFSR